MDSLEAAGRGLKNSIEQSCRSLLENFNTAVAKVHFRKLKLQEEKWFTSFGGVCSLLSNMKDSFLSAKETMDSEVLSFIVNRIDEDRDKHKFLLEIFATETNSIMDALNTTRIAAQGRCHTAESNWQRLLQENVTQCEKFRAAATVTPAVEQDSLHEIAMTLRDAKTACLEIVKANRVSVERLVYTIEAPRRYPSFLF